MCGDAVFLGLLEKAGGFVRESLDVLARELPGTLTECGPGIADELADLTERWDARRKPECESARLLRCLQPIDTLQQLHCGILDLLISA